MARWQRELLQLMMHTELVYLVSLASRTRLSQLTGQFVIKKKKTTRLIIPICYQKETNTRLIIFGLELLTMLRQPGPWLAALTISTIAL